MESSEFKYDVAFSFLAQDERVATDLNDLLQERVSTFLYSKKQEQLAGTDGEKTFNEVFSTQARIVVVLYRPGWGATPWTRIEETAIRNRAYDVGYDFVLFIPLVKAAGPPKWLPKSKIWIGLDRWGQEGAASVIEARVQEAGGKPKQESLEDKAQRLRRQIDAENTRRSFLSSDAGVNAAHSELTELQRQFETQLGRLREKGTFDLKFVSRNRTSYILDEKLALMVTWTGHYANTLQDSSLEVTLWRGVPPGLRTFDFDKPSKIGWRLFEFDHSAMDGNGWREKGNTQFLSTEQLAENSISFLLNAVHSNYFKKT